ncbi:cAMP-regulated D2 protein-like [Mercenaria mercenaria]|uniref:cAMP-regulated D2 protein-like n=1 Tax=Mercenaria mercenaria TaxID=6596 RepID=UPI00234F3260|nr:cAMP-regulated D2 protein-like [Mercenaria mercenaria]
MELVFLILVLTAVFSVNSTDPIVRTLYGDVRGVRTDKSLQFLGIPYASPPTGVLRWTKPVVPSSWGPDVYNATSHKPGCPQKYCTTYLPNASCPLQMSEDCLYLNVWTPLDATRTSGYPVMVFIHGGSFKWGSGSNFIYDGNNLASGGEVVVVNMDYRLGGEVVVVNMDYRLGLLGFLYTGDAPTDANGNYGIQDQRLALQWVQQNIGNFGGNPTKVTLFGQSAGAQSTFIHLMSSKTNGLFRAVIMESPPFAVPYREKEEALLLTERVRKILKCPERDIATCMRTKAVDEINDAQEEITLKVTAGKFNEYYEPIGPIIDGEELTTQPMLAASQGKFRNIPIIIGTTTEEARLFVYGAWKKNLTRTEYEAALAVVHPSHFEKIEEFYAPKPDLDDYRDDLCTVGTDFLFTCANRNATRNFLRSSNSHLYLYVFDHATVVHGGWGKEWFCEGHVCHAAELGYIFQNQLVGKPTSEEKQLASSMLMYWTNFAYSLDPNKGRLSPALTWPKYAMNVTSTMHFLTPKNNLLTNYRNGFCNFWDSVGYEQT